MIDAHVHLFPDDIVWRFYAWIEKKHKLKAVMPIEWKKALNVLKNMGVKQIFNLTHAITPEYSEKLNRWQGELKKKYGFITFGAFHPENSEELLIKAFENKWIDGLKLHPPVQKFRPDSKEALKIYDLLEELKKPLYIHTGWFPDNGFQYSDPKMYEPLIYNYNIPVILAHMMLGKPKELRKFLDARKNVYTETSNALIDITVIDPVTGEKVKWLSEEVVNLIEDYPNRILYGSEIPLVWWKPEKTLKNLLKLNVDEKIKEKILWKNAAEFIEKHIK
ncbi:MAG: amidohydrolase family protein [Candidatus Baldrarchaeota archaeon]